ncbi:MAG: hypothetical protein WBC80_24270 [Isosphaeraceae bacterium]
MKNYWFDEAKKRLRAESSKSSEVQLERLQEQGIINDRGEVTGQLRRRNAFLAITAVKRVAGTREIAVFRCLKPVFGMPGGATIDVSRDSMVGYLKEGKKVITALRDDRLEMWKEGCDVHLSAKGFVRSDFADDVEDDVGSLPEFRA